MLTPGPKTTSTPWSRASSPMAAPTSSTKASSNEQAKALAVGKQVAGTLSWIPRWSSPFSCLRSPWGPSENTTAGMPRFAIACVFQCVSPASSPAFSTVDMEDTTASMSISPPFCGLPALVRPRKPVPFPSKISLAKLYSPAPAKRAGEPCVNEWTRSVRGNDDHRTRALHTRATAARTSSRVDTFSMTKSASDSRCSSVA